jgi:rhodanese-related sulfurtransferase
MLKSLLIQIFLLLLAASYATAGEYRIMSAEEVKKAMDAKKQVMVVDARTVQEFRDGHIPTAINIPPEKLDLMGTLLPKDKKSLIVFYCRGTG